MILKFTKAKASQTVDLLKRRKLKERKKYIRRGNSLILNLSTKVTQNKQKYDREARLHYGKNAVFGLA